MIGLSRKRKQRKQLPSVKTRLRIERLEDRYVCAAGIPNDILIARPALASPSAYNSADPDDVNDDGTVTALDALTIINLLNQSGGSGAVPDSIAEASSQPPFFPDVNDDGFVTPADALQVIDYLNAQAPSTASSSSSPTATPAVPPPVVLPPVSQTPSALPPPSVPGDASLDYITANEVQQLLWRGAAASSSDDYIVAIVDREGDILGVRTKQGVLNTITDPLTLDFAIDGAVSVARTAAFFSSDQGPLTSRTVHDISQSTITQREVQSNPTVPNPLVDNPFNPTDPTATTYGPGFVAPIEIGGEFPAGVTNAPAVDLFNIEAQSRESLVQPGPSGIVTGTAADTILPNLFNVPNSDIPAGQGLNAPDSYGATTGLIPWAQSRGIGTVPGGTPLYKNGELVGGIGVFFPGSTGYADFEQDFDPGTGQTETDHIDAPLEEEAEYIGYAAAGGIRSGTALAPVGTLDGSPSVPGYGLPFGTINLQGITLEIYGPNPTSSNPIPGYETIMKVGASFGQGSGANGANQEVDPAHDFSINGTVVPTGWLVTPHNALPGGGTLTAADVVTMVNQAIAQAQQTTSALRLEPDGLPGLDTEMVIAVSDTQGNILGLYRMPDAPYFSIDVAVAKARNMAYYNNSADLNPNDQVNDELLVERGDITVAQLAQQGIQTSGKPNTPDLYANPNYQNQVTSSTSIAFTNRTFRFLAEPRYPDGVNGSLPPIFSILNDPGTNPANGENTGAPELASAFQSVMGYNNFHLDRNFQDPNNLANQNGIVFFPGSTGLYAGSVLIGGLGVSGDGVDQDDVVTSYAMAGFAPPLAIRVDNYDYRNVSLPFQKFGRNPDG